MSGDNNQSRDAADEAREVASSIRQGARESAETLERVDAIRHARNPLDVVPPASAVTRTAGDALGQVAGSPGLRAAAEGVGAAGEVLRAVRGAVDLAREAAEALEDRLPEAEFSVELHGDVPWRVLAFEATEALSEVPRAEVTVVAEREGADPHAALGHDGALVVTRRGVARRHAGVVSRVEHEGWVDGKVRARVTLVPALWALSQRVNSRVFEAKTVREIVDAVLRPALAPYGRATRWELQRALAPREHSVQYQETDLAFVERLLSEEGISYVIVPGEGREDVVFFDAASSLPAFEGPRGDRLAVSDEEHATRAQESLRSFEETRALTPTRAAVRDFDWTRPDAPVEAEHAVVDDPAGRARPTYLHPADVERDRYDDGTHAFQQHDATFRATLAAQRLQRDARVFTARGNVTSLRPGQRFRVEGHRDAALDRGYVVTAARHVGRAPEETRGREGGPRPERYEAELRCAPDDLALRPAKAHPRPRIFGPQTATVVTTSADDTQSEHHGRVRVRFHWEREGAPAEAQRCWVRVAQAWAGADFGAQFIPRKGMEVVVHFLEGDPDRPLVTGAVYNGTHPLPFPVEGHATRSGIRTHSTDGQGAALPGHFNELSFEDHAGREEVYVHAQRNLREKVRHDHATHVLNDHANTVERDDREVVGRDQHLLVKHDRKVEVGNDQSVLIRHDLDTRIDNYENRFVDGSGRNTTVNSLDKRVVVGNDDLEVTRNQEVSITGNVEHDYHGEHFLLEHDPGRGTTLRFDRNHAKWLSHKSMYLQNPVGEIKLEGSTSSGTVTVSCYQDEIVLHCGESVMHLKKDGTVQLKSTKKVEIESGSARAELDHAGVFTVTAPREVMLTGDGGSMQIKAGDVTVKASGKIKLNA